jgi:hypothetical protein
MPMSALTPETECPTSRRFRRKVGNEIAFYFAGIESNLPDDSS